LVKEKPCLRNLLENQRPLSLSFMRPPCLFEIETAPTKPMDKNQHDNLTNRRREKKGLSQFFCTSENCLFSIDQKSVEKNFCILFPTWPELRREEKNLTEFIIISSASSLLLLCKKKILEENFFSLCSQFLNFNCRRFTDLEAILPILVFLHFPIFTVKLVC
jgi:hypothetical protein